MIDMWPLVLRGCGSDRIVFGWCVLGFVRVVFVRGHFSRRWGTEGLFWLLWLLWLCAVGIVLSVLCPVLLDRLGNGYVVFGLECSPRNMLYGLSRLKMYRLAERFLQLDIQRETVEVAVVQDSQLQAVAIIVGGSDVRQSTHDGNCGLELHAQRRGFVRPMECELVYGLQRWN